MCPILSLGGLEVHAYALFTWIGAAAACLIALPALKRTGMSVYQSLAMLAAMGIGFLVCARLWNMAVNPANFLAMPWYALKLAGLSLYGGIAGSAAALVLNAKIAGKQTLPLLDAMTVPGGVAFCIVRIGCFLNGCCGGIVTNGPLGVRFPQKELAENLPGILSFMSERPRHPTQLYELVGAVIALAAAVLVSKKRGGVPGVRFLVFALAFSAVRLMVLPLRVLLYPPVVKNILYPGLYWCVMVGSAYGILIRTKK